MIGMRIDKTADILNDEDARVILLECFKAPKSLKEISFKKDIPIAKIYSTASKLIDLGYLSRVEEVKREGQNVFLYRTISNEIIVETKENGSRIKICFKENHFKLIETAT